VAGSYAFRRIPGRDQNYGRGEAFVRRHPYLGCNSRAWSLRAATSKQLSLSIPKAVRIVAGGDIHRPQSHGTELNSTDVTSISAAAISPIRRLTAAEERISVGGPGAVDLLAGRNISLGLSQGAVTNRQLVQY